MLAKNHCTLKTVQKFKKKGVNYNYNLEMLHIKE